MKNAYHDTPELIPPSNAMERQLSPPSVDSANPDSS